MTGETRTMAQMVAQRKIEFKKARDKLVSNGLEENQASTFLILRMLMGTFKFNTFTPLEIEDGNVDDANYNWWAPLLAVGDETQGQIANLVSKVLDAGIKISPKLIGQACAALAVFGVAANIYSYYKTSVKESAAVLKIEETIDILEEGKQSIDFFINLINYFREFVNRHSMVNRQLELEAQLSYHCFQTEERFDELSFQTKQKINDLALKSDARINELSDLSLKSDEKLSGLAIEMNNLKVMAEHKYDSLTKQSDAHLKELVKSSDAKIDCMTKSLANEKLGHEMQIDNLSKKLDSIDPLMSEMQKKLDSYQKEIDRLNIECNIQATINKNHELVRDENNAMGQRFIQALHEQSLILFNSLSIQSQQTQHQLFQLIREENIVTNQRFERQNQILFQALSIQYQQMLGQPLSNNRGLAIGAPPDHESFESENLADSDLQQD